MEEMEGLLSGDLRNAYVFGDFNVDLALTDPSALHFAAYMDSHGFLLCNKLPTTLGKFKNSLIDHI